MLRRLRDVTAVFTSIVAETKNGAIYLPRRPADQIEARVDLTLLRRVLIASQMVALRAS
jgi:hypothetical protein